MKLGTAGSILAAIMCAMAPRAPARAQVSPSVVRVHVVALPSDTGRVGCLIFASPDGWPRDRHKAAGREWVNISNEQAVCEFKGLAAGHYAVVVFQDEHETGKMTKNFLGMPTEAYGFSNDAKATLSAPSFADASFQFNGSAIDVTIHAVR
jgi:uncharacterized protein (DUF2141 family)